MNHFVLFKNWWLHSTGLVSASASFSSYGIYLSFASLALAIPAMMLSVDAASDAFEYASLPALSAVAWIDAIMSFSSPSCYLNNGAKTLV